MSKNKSSIWAQEVQYDELFNNSDHYNVAEKLLNEAYEALNRFSQKELKRGKIQKKVKQCWQ